MFDSREAHQNLRFKNKRVGLWPTLLFYQRPQLFVSNGQVLLVGHKLGHQCLDLFWRHPADTALYILTLAAFSIHSHSSQERRRMARNSAM